jgi:hypothetical protein
LIQLDWDGHKMPYRLFKFRVSEAFSGIAGREVAVITIAAGSACGYDFVLGTKYVVYGDKVAGGSRVGVSLCSRTRPVAEATEDLEFARKVPTMRSGGEIAGIAQKFAVDLETGDSDEGKPIAAATVTIRNGDQERSTETGADGKYRFTGLSPGKYSVRIAMPPKLSPQNDREVEVHDRGCAWIDYVARLDGRVRGKLIDARGNSPGVQTVDLLPIIGDKKLRGLWAITDEAGNFEFKDLPPGRYVLAVNLDDAPDEDQPYQTTYFPFTSELSTARVLTIGEGDDPVGDGVQRTQTVIRASQPSVKSRQRRKPH